jgi:hypothetical protein
MSIILDKLRVLTRAGLAVAQAEYHSHLEVIGLAAVNREGQCSGGS